MFPQDLVTVRPTCAPRQRGSARSRVVDPARGRVHTDAQWGGASGREEVIDLGQEAGPGGLRLEQNVVLALQWDEVRPGDMRREVAPLFEGDHGVIARVEHERG